MNNSILLSDEVENVLKTIIPQCKIDLNVISAFCKVSTLKYIDSLVNTKIKKRILVRFLPSDIASGATDKEIYEYCKENKWDIFADHTIHAKTYLFDKIKCIIGSANLTNKGIGISNNYNKEASVFFEIDEESYIKIISLYKDSLVLDDELYKYIISHTKDEEVIQYKSYKQSYPIIECLFPEDFPDTSTDIVDLYNLRSFKWLVSFLREKENKSAFFGEIADNIHNIFVKDPRPYRKDIKQYLVDLLESIKRLEIKEINIIVPNHSELVQLTEKE